MTNFIQNMWLLQFSFYPMFKCPVVFKAMFTVNIFLNYLLRRKLFLKEKRLLTCTKDRNLTAL